MTGKDGRVPSAPGSREPSPDGLGPSGFDPSRVTCPGCGANIAKEWAAVLPDETDLTFVMEVAEGQMIQAQTLGGVVTQFDKMQKAIGREAGAKTTTLIKSLGMDENGTISITFRICNVAQKTRRDSDGSPEGRDAQRLDGEAATARAEAKAEASPNPSPKAQP